MSRVEPRQLLPELVIIAATLFGLWSLFVSPMRDKLAQARAAHASAIEHTRIAADPDLSASRLIKVQGELDAMIDDIRQRSDAARDQTGLQATIMELGAEAGIRIQRVNPARSVAVKSDQAQDRVVSFEIECNGPYRDVAEFIANLEDSVGLTMVERLAFKPDASAGATGVKARLRTLHFAFDTTPPAGENALADVSGAAQ
ncbi:MAG: hypothetical protein H6814_05460 [Phycisphaeraceae bacterium]|nr:hypothetical protein [Phycisphaeraceae bacterium]